ncbi:hypothetical protein AtEden1_Chr2g0230001 [Arabidopsis thaliana]
MDFFLKLWRFPVILEVLQVAFYIDDIQRRHMIHLSTCLNNAYFFKGF